MAADKSNYLRNALVQHAVGIPAYAHSGFTSYLALYVTDPTVADTGTEISGGSYARQAISWDDPAVAGVLDSDTAITFTGLPASTINYWGIRDALTGGNLLYFGPLSQAVTVSVGGTFTTNAGDLILVEA